MASSRWVAWWVIGVNAFILLIDSFSDFGGLWWWIAYLGTVFLISSMLLNHDRRAGR